MEKINQEFELSKKYELKKNELNGSLLELSAENVAHVEAMIRTDSSYSSAGNPSKKPRYKKNGDEKYNGSSAFWFCELKKDDSKFQYDDIIKHAVTAVDSENSTHINSDGGGRDTMTSRILKYSKDELKALLEDKNNEFRLIQELSIKTIPVNEPGSNKKRKGRHNFSFATKFCHFACFWLFDGDNKDKYSIFDSIISKNILKYAKFYNIDYKNEQYNFEDIKDTEEKWAEKYTKYMNLITEILSRAGNNISRNGFDHLVWYYHKGE